MVYLCFQESEESTSDSTNGCEQSAIAKSIPIANVACYQEFPMVISKMHRYGMTFELSISHPPSGNILTSSTVDSHVRTLVLLAMERAWKENEVDCFSRCCAWPKKSDPNLYSLRTFHTLSRMGPGKWSPVLPNWGMIVDGVLYPVKKLERHIKDPGGSYLPTPTASQSGKPIRKPSPSRLKGKHGWDLQDRLGQLFPQSIGKSIAPQYIAWMMGYPTEWMKLKPWAMQLFQCKRNKRSKS